MPLTVLLALAIAANPPALAARARPDPVRAQVALREADIERRSMAAGICSDFPRKAELSQVEAEYWLLKLQLERNYHLAVLADQILLFHNDRDCAGYDDFPRELGAARIALLRARAALGLE